MQTFARPGGRSFLVACSRWFSLLLPLIAVSLLRAPAQDRTRGVGVYPGDPAEDYSPTFIIDSAHYRNLAFHRAAYQSGSYDYNLTAQLITDGIVDSTLPGWIVTTSSTDSILPRNEREWVLDRNPMTRITLDGPRAWLQLELAGNSPLSTLDSVCVSGTLLTDSLPPKHWEVSIRGSVDGAIWKGVGMAEGKGRRCGWMDWEWSDEHEAPSVRSEGGSLYRAVR